MLRAPSIARTEAAGARRETSRDGLDRWGAWLLLLLAGATRLPLAGLSLGESDCGRYLVGMLQWLRHGPDSHFVYGKIFSPGYYAAAVWAVRHSGISAQSLLVGVSVVAAVLTAPLLYWIGRRFCGPKAAMAGAVLFLLAPGVWWLGLEAHPAALALLLLLAAMGLWLRAEEAGTRSWRWLVGAVICLTLALLAKVDFILLGAIFAALAMRTPKQGRWRRVLEGGAIPIAALIVFFVLRPVLAGMSGAAAGAQTRSAVGAFLTLPHGTEAMKQLIPVISYGLGTLALLCVAAVVGFGGRSGAMRAWRARWGWCLAAWVLPSAVVWMSIHGDNARHLAPLLLLPLWAAADALESRRVSGRVLAVGFVLVLAANFWLIPPSSNLTLFPSGNVFASARDLAARQHEMDAWMKTTLADGSPVCFLGNYTLPFLEYARMRPEAGAYLRLGPGGAELDGTQWVEVDSSAGYPAAAAACREAGGRTQSLEYTRTGLHERFLGEEWRSLPLARHFYPGGTVKLER
ncbi:MAG: ArnT family glycosyltransferase [Terriglobales bacterium]